MKKMKRFFSMFLALAICICCTLPNVSISASAATSSDVASIVSARLPLVTYANPISGASRIYSYSDSSLNQKTSGYYIDTYIDQIVILKISADGRAVYVKYPSSSAPSGFRNRWFRADDVLGIETVEVQTYTASAKSTTYRLSASSAVKSYGSIANKDSCAALGSCVIGGKTYYITIYPISASTHNQTTVKYKLALATSAPTKSGGKSNSGTQTQTTVKENAVTYTYTTATLDTSNLANWIASYMKVLNKLNGSVYEIKINSTKKMNIVEPLQGPPVNGKNPTRTISIGMPSNVTLKTHKHERIMRFGATARYSNGSIITLYRCECGFTKELVVWELPLPDPSEFVGNQINNSIRIQSRYYQWLNAK